MADRIKRMAAGAVYCALAATIYILVSSLINVIFYQDLHLAVNWAGLLVIWIEVRLG